MVFSGLRDWMRSSGFTRHGRRPAIETHDLAAKLRGAACGYRSAPSLDSSLQADRTPRFSLYPYLEPDDIRAALEYAAWRVDELEHPFTTRTA
jgi:hypothetical protein